MNKHENQSTFTHQRKSISGINIARKIYTQFKLYIYNNKKENNVFIAMEKRDEE